MTLRKLQVCVWALSESKTRIRSIALYLVHSNGSYADICAAPPNKQLLTDDEILGNAFVFILAGHETAANTIHFSILFLAMHWSSQKHLQDDLDAILGEKPVAEWDYDNDMPKLFGSMCGAVMNEELRLVPPVSIASFHGIQDPLTIWALGGWHSEVNSTRSTARTQYGWQTLHNTGKQIDGRRRVFDYRMCHRPRRP